MNTKKIPGRIIFKTIVGSKAYGTNTPESDVDIKGVYVQDPDDILTFNYKEQVDVTKDECYWEVKRFLQLLQTANPTCLEVIYAPEDCILETSPEFELIRSHKEKFLTKKCYNSFAGYAHQQIEKAKGLNKKMNYEKEQITRKTPLDFCYATFDGKSYLIEEFLNNSGYKLENCGLTRIDHFKDVFALYYDHNHDKNYRGIILDGSTQLRLSAIPKGESPVTTMYFNESEYTKHCKMYKEYQEWLAKRNVARYVDIEEHGQQIDGKNMLHCRRLIDVAREIPLLKAVNVKRPNADYLLSIRKGKVSLDELLNQSLTDLNGLKELYDNSDLPNDVDQDFLNDLLLQIRKMQ